LRRPGISSTPGGRGASATFGETSTAKNAKPNLTWELIDSDEELAFPPGAGPALVGHLAAQTGVPEEQVTRVLAALAAVACAQLRAHPNRFFPIPGLGALIAVKRPTENRINPFTKQPITSAATTSFKFRFAREALDAMRPV
jgi:hypothetical protein